MAGETIDIPKVGKVKRAYVLAGVGILAAYVLYRYWAAGSGGDEEPVDPAFGEGEVLPVVPGAYTPGGGGIPDGSSGTEQKEGPPATNDEWSRKAAAELAGQGGMDYAAVVDALGAYLARKPVTSDQQRLIQAAIAVMGYPPSGSYQVIPVTPGADTAITVAPGGLKVDPSSITATVSWSAVPGAEAYHLFRNDQSTTSPQVVTGTSLIMYNLDPGREYKVWVKAVSAAGKAGPASGTVIFKTTTPTLKAPGGLKATKIERTQVTVTYSAVAGADGYIGFHSGAYVGVASAPNTTMIFGGLQPGKSYKLEVAGRTGVGSGYGPKSAITVKTKK